MDGLVAGARVRQRFRELLDGRPVVCAGGPLAGLARQVPELGALTGRPPFLLAHGMGTGMSPDPGTAVVHVVPASQHADLITAVRMQLSEMSHLPAEAVAALDAWDPERRALVLAGAFFTGKEVAGRRVLDGRSPEWEALEDKSIVDELWDRLGVPRAPSRVVPATYEDARAAAAELDAGSGTVWSGDAREGFNGGAEYVRWVRTDNHARAAAGFFAAHCDAVRVMPFLEGIPCAIHGVVLPDGVAALRPVEMVCLRRTAGEVDRLLYGGISTHWDPPAPDREHMRDVARRVGEGLRERVDYRGGFSVDGVLTAAGFLPTELNPRFSGGLGAIAKGLPNFPLALLQALLVSRHDPGLCAEDLEAVLVSAADSHRWGGGASMLSSVRPDTTDVRNVVVANGGVRLAGEGEPSDAELMLGPSQTGGYLRFEPRAQAVPVGASLAPLVASAFALADALWGTGIGPVAPATDVRTRT